MSLINDALRRANQAQKQQPPQPQLGVPLQPVAHSKPAVPGMFWIIVVAVVLFVLAGWFFFKGTRSGTSETAGQKTPIVSAARPAAGPVTAVNAPPPKAVTAPPTGSSPGPLPVSVPPAVKPGAAVAIPPVNTNLVFRTNSPAPTAASPSAKPETKPSAVVTPPEPALPEANSSESLEFPALKLQGIYFRLVKPSVQINGRTLFVGDRISGTKVVSIERQAVTMEFKGKTKILELE